jgi:Methyltransferase domain
MELSWQNQLPENAYEDFFSRLKKKASRTLLDLSAGYDLVTFFAGKGFSLCSIDARKEILEAGKTHRKVAIDQPSASFDAVLCLGTFDYLSREAAPSLAAEIERMLIPTGLAFVSFAPVWASQNTLSGALNSFSDRRANAYRRGHGRFGAFVVYQNREIEQLFQKFKIGSLVTQTNGARRLIAMKRGQP